MNSLSHQVTSPKRGAFATSPGRDQCSKVKCHIYSPGIGEKQSFFDLHFDGDRPKLVLVWHLGGQKPASCISLDPALLRKVGPPDSLTYIYEGRVEVPGAIF